MSTSISSVKTFYVCNNSSLCNIAIAFIVVLFVKFISFNSIHLCICLFVCLFVCFVRMDSLLFTGLHLEAI